MSNVPKLRFKEFSGEWERKALSQISEMKAGKFIKASEISTNQENEMYPCYGGNGLRGYVKSQTHYGTYSLIGRQGALCGNVQLVSGKFHATEHAIVVTPTNENNTLWQYYELDRLKLNRFATGQAQPGLSVEAIQQIKTYVPSKTEQEKIASFLTSVDTKIEQLTKKESLLQDYKKGVMQKIFNQEIRFKADDGNDFEEWSYKNGNDIFETIANKKHNSDLPILAISQEHGAIPRDMIDYKITVSEKSVATYKVVEKRDYIISLRSFQGGIEYSNYKGICSPAYIILRPFIKINDTFFKIYFKTERYIKQLNRNIEGIRDGKMISYKQFSEIKLPYPCLEEQEKIANFLSSIDKKIEVTKIELEKTKELKKALLQRMFV